MIDTPRLNALRYGSLSAALPNHRVRVQRILFVSTKRLEIGDEYILLFKVGSVTQQDTSHTFRKP